MATHSSILAWKIPWTEEPGRLQSMGSQKSWTQLNKTRRKQHQHRSNRLTSSDIQFLHQFPEAGAIASLTSQARVQVCLNSN